MAKYAKNTSVTIAKSKIQIQDLLTNWGIKEFFFGTSPRGDGIGFKYKEKVYKHNVPMPPNKNTFTDKQYNQQVRQRWRILYMSLKMKLEEIDSGGISFEDQFLAMMCLPDGSTVGGFMKLPENLGRLEKTQMPRLLTN